MTNSRKFFVNVAIGGGMLVLLAAPAQARLHNPGYGGPASGGAFHGIPIRQPAATSRSGEREISGMARDGGECRIIRQQVRDRLGGLNVRAVRVCD
jgi:hypothetical protein